MISRFQWCFSDIAVVSTTPFLANNLVPLILDFNAISGRRMAFYNVDIKRLSIYIYIYMISRFSTADLLYVGKGKWECNCVLKWENSHFHQYFHSYQTSKFKICIYVPRCFHLINCSTWFDSHRPGKLLENKFFSGKIMTNVNFIMENSEKTKNVIDFKLTWARSIVIAFCALCVVCHYLLLCNQWFNCDETSQKVSSQCPHQNSFKFLGSMQNSCFHGNQTKKNLKYFLLLNWLADFQIIL